MVIQQVIGFAIFGVGVIGFILWHYVLRKKLTKYFPTKLEAETKEQYTAAKSGTGKFRAMVWTDTGIVFKKIDKKVGVSFFCDASMPEKGDHLLVKEIVGEDGTFNYESVDPRELPIVSNETPEWAYDSTHCYKEVYAWFKNKADIWDKVNVILIGLAIGGMLLVALAALDKVVR